MSLQTTQHSTCQAPAFDLCNRPWHWRSVFASLASGFQSSWHTLRCSTAVRLEKSECLWLNCWSCSASPCAPPSSILSTEWFHRSRYSWQSVHLCSASSSCVFARIFLMCGLRATHGLLRVVLVCCRCLECFIRPSTDGRGPRTCCL